VSVAKVEKSFATIDRDYDAPRLPLTLEPLTLEKRQMRKTLLSVLIIALVSCPALADEKAKVVFISGSPSQGPMQHRKEGKEGATQILARLAFGGVAESHASLRFPAVDSCLAPSDPAQLLETGRSQRSGDLGHSPDFAIGNESESL